MSSSNSFPVIARSDTERDPVRKQVPEQERNRTLAVGKGIEEEIREEIDHPRVVPEPAKRMEVGIDGAFVKAGHTRAGQGHQFEILIGRVEALQRGGDAFAVVRDLDSYAKRRVQAVLRRCGRGQDTDLRILLDGEDGLRGVVGTWFGKKCQHRLDWFQVARRIARIEKEFLYLPYGQEIQERLAAHWANLNSMKWMLWNDGVEMADFGMTVDTATLENALSSSMCFEGPCC